MTKAIIKPETKEETILREYRHLRTIVTEEKAKVLYFSERLERITKQISDKKKVIKINEARLAALRKQAAKIIKEMLDEGDA